ncbi:nitrate reductase [Chamaesiphon sp. VAR_69_metabat_338]|uniref:molybdopterin oxidoreductase family protein n=1 Tax=Chamaesiphon sp. VAR_69_metabat_338 TaxID=2964704 RepID=UPI00286E1CD1|nr:nitrate reductase [Chamaesiphon sp. VAR_69_metabat_338]
MTDTTKTLCPYCGVGCGLEASPPAVPGKSVHRDSSGVPIWKVMGDRSHPSSQGMVCVKGATISESLYKDRLMYPMVRDSLDQPFQRATWEEAYSRIVSRMETVLDTQGADAICMYGSGQMQTEDYYIAQKLLKGCLGTNNFDANSRLCMSSAVSGYIQSFGADGPPCCYDDIEKTDFAFLIGTNTAECHPIIFNRLRKYHKQHDRVKMVVVDPRRTATAEAADIHLAITPGTDIDLLNGIAYLLLRAGKVDQQFIESCTSNFAAFADILQHYPPHIVAAKCGISQADLEQTAKWWGASKNVLSFWSMGVNQSSEGTAKVRHIINLHLMTGQIGRPGAGPFSLTGQPNAMGGREAGGLAHILPGYRLVKNPAQRAEIEKLWDLPEGRISPNTGKTAWEMITGLETGAVGLLWVVATNPAVSMPDINRTKAALRRSAFTIHQDAYYPTETAKYAHVLLPAAQWSEKTGVMTNSERTVTLCPAFRTPPGEAKADWEIFAEVGRRLGFTDAFWFKNSADVYAEFARLSAGRPCDVTGLSHQYLKDNGPTQWPHPTGCKTQYGKRLYTDLAFHHPDKRAKFAACHSKGLAEPPSPDYPFVLTTGRLYGHWHTMTRTGRIPKIQQMHPEPFVEIHPKDAARLQIENGEIVEIRSRRGTGRFPALVTAAIDRGTVFVPMHWGELWAKDAEANLFTHDAACPDSLQPELKACAVQLVPVKSIVPASSIPFGVPSKVSSKLQVYG